MMGKSKILALLIGMGVLSLYFLFKTAGNLQVMEVVGYIFLLGLLIKITESNIRLHIYEDKLTFPTMGLGVLANSLIAFNAYEGYSIIFQKIGLSIAGILIGGFGLYLTGVVADFIFKKESIGGGDIKLVAAMGAFVGPFIVWFIPIWLLSVVVFGLVYKAIGALKKDSVGSVIPTAPVHFVSLISLLFIQKNILDLISVIIAVVVLFLGCNCLFNKEKKEDR